MRQVLNKGCAPYYSVFTTEGENGMAFLRELFPEGKADYMNFVLFSTSGVHGSYQTIEDAEAFLSAPTITDDTDNSRVTFLVVHPRIVCLKYGNCEPESAEDIEFLKSLRASSRDEMVKLGWPA